MHYEIDVFTHTRGGAAPRRPTAVVDLPEGETLILLVDGSETGWDSGYQPVMDFLIGTFPAALVRTWGPMNERLIRATEEVDEAFGRRFPEVRSLSEYEDDVVYSATFLAAVIERKRLWTAWIGSQQAKLFRQGRCVEATAPHAVLLPSGTPCTTRYMHSSPRMPPAPLETCEPWQLQVGDAAVVADARLFKIAADETVGEIVCGGGPHPAEELVRRVERVKEAFLRSAIVVRVHGGAAPPKGGGR